MRTEQSTAVIEVRDLMEMLSRFNPSGHVRILVRQVPENTTEDDYTVHVTRVFPDGTDVTIEAI